MQVPPAVYSTAKLTVVNTGLKLTPWLTFRPHSSLGYRPPAPEARWVPPPLISRLQATENGPAILT